MGYWNNRDRVTGKRVHYLTWHNYYACNRAVGNGVRGLATKNPKLVTCFNCFQILTRDKRFKVKGL
jgi:hypothetical protein